MRFTPELMQPLSAVSAKKSTTIPATPYKDTESDNIMDDLIADDRFSEEAVVDIVDDMWRIWVGVSARDDHTLSPRIKGQIMEVSAPWETTPWHQVEMIIRSAVFLPPTPGEDDASRLVGVLGDDDIRSWASELSSRVDCPPFLHGKTEDMTRQFNDIVGLFDTEPVGREESWLIWEMTDYPLEEIEDVVFSLEDVTFASVFDELRNRHSELFPTVSKENQARNIKKDHSPLVGSLSSSSDDVAVITYNDLQARDMMTAGHPERAVLSHHRDGVPEGYWDRVDAEVVAGQHGDLMDIYDYLEKEYNFHPEDRDIPSL